MDLNQIPTIDFTELDLPQDISVEERLQWMQLGYRVNTFGFEEYACFINTDEGLVRVTDWTSFEAASEEYDILFEADAVPSRSFWQSVLATLGV